MSDSQKTEPGRRVKPRKTVLKSGRAIFKNARASAQCLVTDLSDGGARLEFSAHFDVPETFAIEIGKEAQRPCKVRWRRGVHVGVSFE